MSWTRATILPARDMAGGAVSVLRDDIDFIAAALRARGATTGSGNASHFLDYYDAWDGESLKSPNYFFKQAIDRSRTYLTTRPVKWLSALPDAWPEMSFSDDYKEPEDAEIETWAFDVDTNPSELSIDNVRRIFCDIRDMKRFRVDIEELEITTDFDYEVEYSNRNSYAPLMEGDFGFFSNGTDWAKCYLYGGRMYTMPLETDKVCHNVFYFYYDIKAGPVGGNWTTDVQGFVKTSGELTYLSGNGVMSYEIKNVYDAVLERYGVTSDFQTGIAKAISFGLHDFHVYGEVGSETDISDMGWIWNPSAQG